METWISQSCTQLCSALSRRWVTLHLSCSWSLAEFARSTSGHYDGVPFNRVVPGFIAQIGGDDDCIYDEGSFEIETNQVSFHLKHLSLLIADVCALDVASQIQPTRIGSDGKWSENEEQHVAVRFSRILIIFSLLISRATDSSSLSTRLLNSKTSTPSSVESLEIPCSMYSNCKKSNSNRIPIDLPILQLSRVSKWKMIHSKMVRTRFNPGLQRKRERSRKKQREKWRWRELNRGNRERGRVQSKSYYYWCYSIASDPLTTVQEQGFALIRCWWRIRRRFRTQDQVQVCTRCSNRWKTQCSSDWRSRDLSDTTSRFYGRRDESSSSEEAKGWRGR